MVIETSHERIPLTLFQEISNYLDKAPVSLFQGIYLPAQTIIIMRRGIRVSTIRERRATRHLPCSTSQISKNGL